jgi:hypothetical protein
MSDAGEPRLPVQETSEVWRPKVWRLAGGTKPSLLPQESHRSSSENGRQKGYTHAAD